MRGRAAPSTESSFERIVQPMDDWLRQRAREMRREPAVYERRLWKLLRDRRLAGLKFRRQFVFEDGPYIADFICFRHRLIVEADGPRHDPERDAERDSWLRGQGFRVLRFANQVIETRGHEVVAAILAAAGVNVDRN